MYLSDASGMHSFASAMTLPATCSHWPVRQSRSTSLINRNKPYLFQSGSHSLFVLSAVYQSILNRTDPLPRLLQH